MTTTPAEVVAKARREADACRFGRAEGATCAAGWPFHAGVVEFHEDAHIAAAIAADRRAVASAMWEACTGYPPRPGSFGEGMRNEHVKRLAKEGAP